MEQRNREMRSQPHLVNKSYYQFADEITLMELWQILEHRKYWILVIFFACVAIGALYAQLKTSMYETATKIRIGQVAGIGTIEDSDILTTSLIVKYGKFLPDGKRRNPPFLIAANRSKATKEIVELTAAGLSPAQAATFLKKISDEIIHEHRTTYDNGTSMLRQHIQTLDDKKNTLQKELENTSQALEALKQHDSVQASFTFLEQRRIDDQLYRIDAELLNLHQNLTPPKTIPSEVLGEILPPAVPAGPHPPLIIALASVVGLLSGILIAFFVEFISNIKTKSIQ